MAVTRQQKEEILQELVDKFAKTKTVVFADYRGLDVKSISDLRGKLREGNAEAKVAKKTLIKLAAKENKIDEIPDEVMEGPVATIFSYEDELAGIQILYKFAKGNDNLKLLGGIIDGKVVGLDVISKYAKLPSKEELFAKLVGSMQSPISGTVGILSNLVGGLVRVINAYKDTLPAEEAPKEAPKAEEKAEEKTETPAEAPADVSTEAEAKEEEAKADTPDESSDKEESAPAEESAPEDESAEAPTDVSAEAEGEATEETEEKPEAEESEEEKTT